jgi:hypothetical protein
MVFTRGRSRSRSGSRSRIRKRSRVVSRSRSISRGRLSKRARPFVKRLKFKSLRARKNQAGLSRFNAPACKTTVVADDLVQSYDINNFEWTNLCRVPYNGANTQNARSGQECNVIGFRIRETYKNVSTYVIKCHQIMAIPKQWDPLKATADLTDDFYRRHGLAEDNDGSWSSLLGSYLFEEPVNPDKWTVLYRTSFLLSPGQTAIGPPNFNNVPNYDNYKEIDKWVPLRRRFTYGSLSDAGETTAPPNQPPVIYITFAHPVQTFNGVATPNLVTRERHLITYFRDGSSGM